MHFYFAYQNPNEEYDYISSYVTEGNVFLEMEWERPSELKMGSL